MKRMICCALVLLLALTCPGNLAASASNAPTPSIEEILAEYHASAFQQSSGTPAPCSLPQQDNGPTLEEETVDALCEAGYHAYNITSSNYDAVEASLQTDFADMGLDPNGNYIMIVGGEELEPASITNPTTPSPFPEQDIFGDDEDNSNFYYTQDGITYLMRYVTLTSADSDTLWKYTEYRLSDAKNFSEYIDDILSHGFSYAVSRVADKITDKIPLVSILDLLIDIHDDTPLTLVDSNSITIRAGTTWTQSYLQIWNEEDAVWHTCQFSSYARSLIKCDSSLLLDKEKNEFISPESLECSFYTYSAQYFEPAQRKASAVLGYELGARIRDRTGDIHFYVDTTSGININGTEPLFSHRESTIILLPLIEEE